MTHLEPSTLPPLTFGGWLRHDHIAQGLRGVPVGARILEIGPGMGAMGARLARTLDYVGVEVDDESRAAARRRVSPAGGTVVAGLDDVSGEFEVACAFEVLEHIEDDVAALREWVTRVAVGGRFLASVPADPDRMGPWDRMVGHYRRYSAASLAALFRHAGLDVMDIRAVGFPVGYATEWIRNQVARPPDDLDMGVQTGRSGRLLQPGSGGAAAVRLASIPQRVLTQVIATNKGTGLVATGVKR